jgi:sarcosine oxidase subunit gamma
MLEHRPAFESHDGGAGAVAAGPAAPRASAVTGLGLLLLQGDPRQAEFAGAVRGQFGVDLPAPGAIAIGENGTLLWLGPRQCLAQLTGVQLAAATSALEAKLAGLPAALTDLSDALAVFDVGGARAGEALMQGCSIDLRPHAFAAGRVVRTLCAGAPMIIWKCAPSDPLRCAIDRSLAWHFARWLTDPRRAA